MSFADDAPDFAPARTKSRGGLFTPLVWISVGSALTCIVLALVFMAFAPKLFGPKPAAPAPATGSAPTPMVQPVTPPLAAAPPSTVPQTPAVAPPASGAILAAAELALAIDSISEASETGRPFTRQMALVDALAPGSKGAETLRPLADRGAPTLAVLVAEYPETARRAAYASRAPAKASGFWARLSYAANVLFTVRRTDRLTGAEPDAVLARAEHLLYEGDVDGALKALDGLPPKGKDASAAWRDRALRRSQLQNGLEALRAEAILRLDAARRGGAQ